MRDHQASHTALITSLLLLLVAIISVNAQSRKSGRQEQRGVNGYAWECLGMGAGLAWVVC
jgi:hypothetical protein